LLATRLIESGVKFVTIQLGGWDTHINNFNTASRTTSCPTSMPAWRASSRALDAEGFTVVPPAVFVTGEFGRTPKINKLVGRDHYPRSMCV